MTAQCSTCFFGQTTQAFGNSGLTMRVCRNAAPAHISAPGMGADSYTYWNQANATALTARWIPVADTDWCGDGADSASGMSFSNLVYGKPGTSSPPQTHTGMVTLSAATTTTVTDSNVDASSRISFWPTNASARLLFAQQGLSVTTITPSTSFVLTVGGGASAAGTETFGYQIIG